MLRNQKVHYDDKELDHPRALKNLKAAGELREEDVALMGWAQGGRFAPLGGGFPPDAGAIGIKSNVFVPNFEATQRYLDKGYISPEGTVFDASSHGRALEMMSEAGVDDSDRRYIKYQSSPIQRKVLVGAFEDQLTARQREALEATGYPIEVNPSWIGGLTVGGKEYRWSDGFVPNLVHISLICFSTIGVTIDAIFL